ncbi:MAG: hypothetical protein HWE13_10275 [Gammaproteobacteria bacterium]|nr:hypothetical protein [Gammaproteobacteria bacterium]
MSEHKDNDPKWSAIESALKALPKELAPETSQWSQIERTITRERPKRGWMPFAVAASVMVAVASTAFSINTALSLKAFKSEQLAYQMAQEEIQYREHQRRLVKASFVQNLNQVADKLDSATIADIQNNLAIIEQAMLDIRAALAKQPGNERLTQLLQETYNREQQLIENVQSSYPQLRGEA